MKKRAVVLCAALALFLNAPVAAEGGGLARIVRAAEEYNAGLQAERARLESSGEGEKIALAELLPQISGSATFPNGDLGGESESYSLSLSQQILNLGVWRSWQAEKHGTAAAESDFSAARQSLRLTVSTAWLEAQYARAALRLTEARRETVREQLKRARFLEEAGEGTRVDVLSSQARADAVQAEWVSAGNAWETARANVARLAGALPDAAALSDSYVPPAPPEIEDWLGKIRAEANEIAAARARVERARLQLRAADSVWVPRVIFSMPLWEESSDSGGGGGGGNGGNDDDFTIRIEQNFYTGGRATAERRRLVSQLRELEARLLELERDVEDGARVLDRDARSALQRIQALHTAEESARAALDSVALGYEAGVRVVADVLNAEEALFDSRVQLSRAHYDHIASLVRLRALAGALDDDFIAEVDGFFSARNSGE